MGTSDEEIARAASPNEELLGRQPTGGAGQHEFAEDRRTPARRKAGDTYLATVAADRRVDTDHVEGLRSLQAALMVITGAGDRWPRYSVRGISSKGTIAGSRI
jgi:hypothetical protein